MTMTARIIQEIKKDPYRTSSDIAAAAGARADLVRNVALRNNLSYGTRKARAGEYFLPLYADKWLREEAKKMSILPLELLLAIVVDAMNEEETTND